MYDGRSDIDFSALLYPVLLVLLVGGGGSAGADVVVMAAFCKYVDKVLGRTVQSTGWLPAHTECVTSSSSSLPSPHSNL